MGNPFEQDDRIDAAGLEDSMFDQMKGDPSLHKKKFLKRGEKPNSTTKSLTTAKSLT